MAWERRRSKRTDFQIISPCSHTASSSKWIKNNQKCESFNARSWVMQWRIHAVGRIRFGNVLLVGYCFMRGGSHWLIDWLIRESSWGLLSPRAQPWIAPVSVLAHSWPTFSLFLPFPRIFEVLSICFVTGPHKIKKLQQFHQETYQYPQTMLNTSEFLAKFKHESLQLWNWKFNILIIYCYYSSRCQF